MTKSSSAMTVGQLAERVGTDVERLITQLTNAGIEVNGPDYPLSDKEKEVLLKFLQRSHGEPGAAQNQVTLTRKKVSSIKIGNSQVRVDVRSKRTYVKRKPVVEAQAEPDSASSLENLHATQESVFEEVIPTVEEIMVGGVSEASIPEMVGSEQVALPIITPEKDDKTLPKVKSLEEEDAAFRSEKERDKEKKEKDRLSKIAKVSKTQKKETRRHFVEIEEEPEEDFSARPRRRSSGNKKAKKDAKAAVDAIRIKHSFEKPTEPMIHEVGVPETISIGDLAQKMSVKVSEVIKKLMHLGTMATINQVIDQDTAMLVVEEFGHKAKATKYANIEDSVEIVYSTEPKARPPVVTIMGHVDHGKTSLLDYIRKSTVAAKEAGGITQHIGAYQVQTSSGKVTFLDTPGHEAFTAMRARGAKATDIVVLVVAGDDGVRPQTIEAIAHAKAANVPVVVAVNKMDKPESDIERVKQEMVQHGVVPEDWGGDTQFVPVSARTGDGVDRLLEALSVLAEISELKAPFEGAARGVVVESRLEKGRGPVATILVQAGSLKPGDIVLAGVEYGRVRALLNEYGEQLQEALPSTPVEILGLSNAPQAGDEFVVVPDERKAREVAMFRHSRFRDIRLARQNTNLDDFLARIKESEANILNIVLKADVQGSLEALSAALTQLSHDEIKVKIVVSGVGGISESDINLALASSAIVVGFNVRADSTARQLAEKEGIALNYYSIIYDVIDQVKNAMMGRLVPKFKEEIIGVAQVRDVFHSSKFGTIAGCMVTEGTVKRNKPIRVLRSNVVIYEGELESLKRFKDDAGEVRQGYECGIGVKGYSDVKVGDQIEVYDRVQVQPQLVT